MQTYDYRRDDGDRRSPFSKSSYYWSVQVEFSIEAMPAGGGLMKNVIGHNLTLSLHKILIIYKGKMVA